MVTIEEFEDAYKQNKGKLVSYMLRRGAGNNADDWAQAAWTKGFANLHQCEDRSSLVAWIYTIAKNYALEEMRKRAYKLTVQMPEDLTLFSKERDHDKLEASLDLPKFMSRLGKDSAMILKLRYLDELSVKETAKAAGLTQQNVKTKTRRSLQAAVLPAPSVQFPLAA